MIKTIQIPIVTAVTAGRGIPDDLTDWEITGFRDVRLVDPDSTTAYFGVPVEGDSLVNLHICEGDILVCKRARRYEAGTIGIWQTPMGRTAKLANPYPDDSVVLHNGGSWSQMWQSDEVRLLGIVVRVERDI